MKLLNPTDQELNEAFATQVCGWWKSESNAGERMWNSEGWSTSRDLPNFTQSADAVLPFLGLDWMVNADRKGFVGVQYMAATDKTHYAQADTFPRAAVIALLRANGVEVEFT